MLSMHMGFVLKEMCFNGKTALNCLSGVEAAGLVSVPTNSQVDLGTGSPPLAQGFYPNSTGCCQLTRAICRWIFGRMAQVL